MYNWERKIYDKIRAEAIRLRPNDPIVKITRKDALKVVKEWELDHLFDLAKRGIDTIFERKSRGGRYIQL